MSKRLEKVENFADLKAGVEVVYMFCSLCNGGAHRFRLTRFTIGTSTIDGELIEGWKHSPEANCDGDSAPAVLQAIAVERGKVFRVVDGLEAPALSESARKKESV